MSGINNREVQLRKKIKAAIIVTIIGLLLNGISAVPLVTELRIVLSNSGMLPQSLRDWLVYVEKGITETTTNYKFMRYGFDWLAFAHFLIAIAFFGPLKDPVKNEWVISWGMIASVLSLVMALAWERYRGIPFVWSLIDAVVAIVAFVILWLCYKWIQELKKQPVG